MRYHNITHDDMLNGDGLRVVLWVAGCEHKCPGCQNPETWDCEGGIPFTEWEEAEFWEWLKKPWTKGATFSGGDPLHPANRNAIGKLAEAIKKYYPGKDIWVYTGYTLCDDNGIYLSDDKGNTFTLPWLQSVDILVDKKFDINQRKKDIEERRQVYWRGSSNQRIIEIPKTLECGTICERKEK